MSLDASYLEYPKRRHGMDHDLYPWTNIRERKPVLWPEGKSVALLLSVPLEYFPLEVKDKPFKAPGHMQTPYPDLRHYSSREYGTRVGFYRFLDLFAKHGLKASITMNAAIAERYPELVRDVQAAGHEIIAHSTDMNGIQFGGQDEAEERALIRDTLDRLERATGTRPTGWHSIARSQSFNTPRLLTEAGVRYMCDWPNDDLPYVMTTEAGEIINLPLNHELADRQIITVCQNSESDWAEQMKDAHSCLAGEAERFGGRVLPITLTPYIMGLPYRIAALDETLGWLASQPATWSATAGEIVSAWTAQA
ncbi:polysaccharide deacetylase family protein [Govanella unica]|uniref:Chitooligosaccharide deacetylase n=1 Tax=Govanella unica TaxID=2975056 RepID=A0A9X3Z6F9_9PROT|nr:polysaccharide deacetylase family protein [Govania unica]MDA5192889.1 polysaccharide deacetylase family protein [Govania unica]